MTDLLVPNVPESVVRALKTRVADGGEIGDAARSVLIEWAGPAAASNNIDFTSLERELRAAGLPPEDMPTWDEAMDDHAFSRRVLGLDV